MCGIVGVAGVLDASRVTYLGLYSLQHRGQESAGIVAVDGAGVARSHRGMGLVSDIFAEPVLAGLEGDVAGGHTRYSTAGARSEERRGGKECRSRWAPDHLKKKK